VELTARASIRRSAGATSSAPPTCTAISTSPKPIATARRSGARPRVRGVRSSVIEERTSDDDLVTAYAERGPAPLDRRQPVLRSTSGREFDTTSVAPTGVFQDRFDTERLRPELRFFTHRGFFAYLSGTKYDQEVDQFDDLTSAARTTVSSHVLGRGRSRRLPLPKRWARSWWTRATSRTGSSSSTSARPGAGDPRPLGRGEARDHLLMPGRARFRPAPGPDRDPPGSLFPGWSARS